MIWHRTAVHYEVVDLVPPQTLLEARGIVLHALDRSSGRERNVRLLATSTNSVWISQEDIPWLVCYVTDEVMKGGVVMSEMDDKPALDINTSVPHLNVQWDFESGDLWIAEFGAGDLAGTKVSSSVKEL